MIVIIVKNFALFLCISLIEIIFIKNIFTKIIYHDKVQIRNKFSPIKEKNFLKICEKKAKRFQSVFKTNTLQVKGENVMRITELLRKSSIALQVDMQSKEETIDYLVDLKQKTH